MERTISIKMKAVNASKANPNGKTLTGDKSLGLDQDLHFY